MTLVHSATETLCDCLGRIAALLEKGESVAAAAIVVEMNELFPLLPPDMHAEELAVAQRSLERCVQLEQGLRHSVLVSLQRLAATRRSVIYRRYDNGA